MLQERTNRIVNIGTRVVRAETDPRQAEYLAAFTAADRSICSLVVCVELEDGRTGEGEATPLASWSGETVETSKLLVEAFLAPHLAGMEAATAKKRLWSLHAGAPYLLWAIEAALVDATRPRAGLAGMPIRGFVGAVAPGAAAELAAEQAALGFAVLKVKLGGSLADDRARLCAVRDAAPAALILVDANGALAVRELDRYGRLFVDTGVVGVEQPIARDAVLRVGLPEARGWHWIADESVWGIDDALVNRAGPWHAWTVHPAKARGLQGLEKVAAIASLAGIGLVSGSHMHVAAGVPAIGRVADRLPDSPLRRLLADDVCAPVVVPGWSHPDVTVARGRIRVARS